MPFKDPEQKRKAQHRWRHSRTPEYMKYLYDRRAFRFWKAEQFEKILRQIATGDLAPGVTPAQVAAIWLDEALQREQEVGFYFDHVENQPTNVVPPGRPGRRRISSGDTG